MRKTREERIFSGINIAFMIFFVIIIMFPLLNILALSFNDALDTLKGGIYLIPRKFSLESYVTVLEDKAIYRAFIVSIAKTIVGVLLHTFAAHVRLR